MPNTTKTENKKAIDVEPNQIVFYGGIAGGSSSAPPAPTLTGSHGVHRTVNDFRLGDAELSPAFGDWLQYSLAGLWENFHSALNAQSGTSYTITLLDRYKFITFTNAAAIAVTLPQAGVNFPDGWWCDLVNQGAGVVTVTPTVSTIDGLASITLSQYQGVKIFSNGVNFFTQRGLDSTIPSALDIIGWQRSWMGI